MEAAAGYEFTLVFENEDDRSYALRADFGDIEASVPAGGTIKKTSIIPEKPGEYEIACESGPVFELESVPAEVLQGCGIDDDE